MNIKELAEQAGCAEINLYDVGKFIDLDLFAELILEQERKEAAEHYLKMIRDCVATEREQCAKLCEEQLENTMLLTSYPPKSAAAFQILQLIKARGEQA